ncbi:MAG: 2-oxoacid:ferredoxin oxidoreductase subunit beta [Nitrospirae bacterium]|nr:2-oxoacid:ferredoxin oxidoreductase subunit beta [Nitrospirota bacterium]
MHTPRPPPAPKLTRKDFLTEQEVRWCPGCGDYSILNATTQAFAQLGIPREKFVIVSGIGCSSRLPYYVNTYGFHGIHGRAPAIATGVALANPELHVWVVTGDGDALSIGGNHFIHTLRRNVNLKILLFDNRIYGLTKGQYSPTSEFGKINKSAPYGTLERPVDPIALALAAGATFVARSVDIYQKHLAEVLRKAAQHRGTAFIHIFQNCYVYNDNAFTEFADKDVRDERNVDLEHGRPVLFGKNRDKGIRLDGMRPEVVTLGNGVTEKDVLTYDTRSLTLAHIFAQMAPPAFPMPIGILHQEERPPYEELVYGQLAAVREAKGAGDLRALFRSGETWEVRG